RTRPIGVQEVAQRPEVADQRARKLHGAPATDAGAQELRQQLGVRERRRAKFKQLLARALCDRPVANGHDLLRSRSAVNPMPRFGGWAGAISSRMAARMAAMAASCALSLLPRRDSSSPNCRASS